MTDVQASIGLVQLRKLSQYNQRRAELAGLYTRLFSDVPGIETPTVRPEVESNWHLYVVRLRDVAVSRDEVIERLKTRGIGSAVHYYPVHYHPFYDGRFGLARGQYPVTEAEFERLISLPLFPEMSERDVSRVVAAVRESISA